MTHTARRQHQQAHDGSWLTESIRGLRRPARRSGSAGIGRVLPLVVALAPFAVGLAAAAVWAIAADPPAGSEWLGALALLGSAIVAEAFPVPLEGVSAGRTSLATVFIVGAAVIYDWRLAGLIGFLTMATVELGRRRPAVRVVFNTSIYTLAAGAAGGAAAVAPAGGLLSRCL